MNLIKDAAPANQFGLPKILTKDMNISIKIHLARYPILSKNLLQKLNAPGPGHLLMWQKVQVSI
jgi:hypothetical protein